MTHPPGILLTRLEEIALAPAVEFDPAAARAFDAIEDVSGLWIVVQVLSNDRVRLHRAARDGDAEITAHYTMLRPVSRDRLLEAFRTSTAENDIETRSHEAAPAPDASKCVRCGQPMIGPDGQCYGGICHDCAGCADPHAGHDHTADPDFTVDGCAECEALVAESKRAFAAEREKERQREIERLLGLATKLTDARAAVKRPYNAATTECDATILAAVIIADAIGDLTDAVKRLADIADRER